jgi:hypothetical protein
VRFQIDPFRSLLAGTAAVLAAIGAAAGIVDTGMGNGELVTRVLGFEAIVDAAFVVIPSHGLWSGQRRAMAALAAVFWAALALLLLILYGSRAACGCGDPSTGYALPTLLGFPAKDWVPVAAVAGPFLMAATVTPLLDPLVRWWKRRSTAGEIADTAAADETPDAK